MVFSFSTLFWLCRVITATVSFDSMYFIQEAALCLLSSYFHLLNFSVLEFLFVFFYNFQVFAEAFPSRIFIFFFSLLIIYILGMRVWLYILYVSWFLGLWYLFTCLFICDWVWGIMYEKMTWMILSFLRKDLLLLLVRDCVRGTDNLRAF